MQGIKIPNKVLYCYYYAKINVKVKMGYVR